jgi:thymidine kinase
MQAKRYTAKSYIDAINQYPRFWNYVRPNTLEADSCSTAIALNISKLRSLYPELRPAQIYFTIGALRSGGTTQGNMILIGCEMAFSRGHTITSEFPATDNKTQHSSDSNLYKSIAFTSTHEYVHTQQKTTLTDYLLAQCVMEGVAEFVAVKAVGQVRTLPAQAYIRDNMEKVRQKFETQLFNPDNGFWLYSDKVNEFGVRDLGYCVGYAICEKYYDKAADKTLAIKQMIRLDYANENDLAAFVDAAGYLDVPVQTLKARYEASRPVVISVKPIADSTDNAGKAGNASPGEISSGTQQLTIVFSTPMDKGYRNFELGPLGKDHALKIKRIVGFSEDGRSLTLETDLLPATHYQLVIGPGFRNADGARLKPYLFDFNTASR